MNTLMSPKVVEVLDRLFTAAEESETTLEELADSEASRLITSKSGYRQFYGLMKDIPLPVSRETGSLLYMLTSLDTGAVDPGVRHLLRCVDHLSRPPLYGITAGAG